MNSGSLFDDDVRREEGRRLDPRREPAAAVSVLVAAELAPARLAPLLALGSRAACSVTSFECHTASARARDFEWSMNGLGPAPRPSAICSIGRFEATDRSASRIDSPFEFTAC